MATKRSKDFLVSTADVAFYHSDMLAFTGTTSLNTSISVSMEDQEITGGKLDKLLYKYKYGRRVSLTIEMAEWRLEYIAAQVGSALFEGLKDVFAIAECVTLTNGVGTLAKTPVEGSKVYIEKADHSILEVEAEGNVITIDSDEETEIINATYKYNAEVRSITIDADASPYVGELVMSADLHNNLRGKIGEVQIDVPSFQLSGTFDISMESTGNTTTEMDGDALAVDGDTCSDGTVYAYVTEILDDATETAITDIAATPAVVEIAVGETATITVVGIRGGIYSNVGIDVADCTITSDDASIADVADGVITGVAAGSTMINVEYEGMQDVIKVTVTE